jgi:hypothetical protein
MKFNGRVPDTGLPRKPPPPAFNNGHWTFPEKMGDGVGFIYVIRDNVLGRHYLGKKSYLTGGKLNYGRETDWRRYLSSSKLLAVLLKERPREEFEFIAIEQYRTKGTLSYAETWSLCRVEAPTSVTWYNTRVEKVSWSVKEPISQRHKLRLEMLLDKCALRDFG